MCVCGCVCMCVWLCVAVCIRRARPSRRAVWLSARTVLSLASDFSHPSARVTHAACKALYRIRHGKPSETHKHTHTHKRAETGRPDPRQPVKASPADTSRHCASSAAESTRARALSLAARCALSLYARCCSAGQPTGEAKTRKGIRHTKRSRVCQATPPSALSLRPQRPLNPCGIPSILACSGEPARCADGEREREGGREVSREGERVVRVDAGPPFLSLSPSLSSSLSLSLSRLSSPRHLPTRRHQPRLALRPGRGSR